MTIVDVQKNTFTALCLAQAAINAARAALPYGSANQKTDWEKLRGGGDPKGQTLPRLTATRQSTGTLLKQAHSALPSYFGVDDTMYARAISGGVAMYYGSGNCGEHANLTFCFLATFGYPGIEVSRVSSTVLDHAYTLIHWKACEDPIVCDAWPTSPQACLWSQFFANPDRTRPGQGYKVDCSYAIADMGNDIIGDAFAAVDPDRVRTLQPRSSIGGWTEERVSAFLNGTSNGVYDHTSTLPSGSPSSIDFRCGTDLMSRSVPPGEKWSAKLLPAIADVGDRLKLLDPGKRYTGRT